MTSLSNGCAPTVRRQFRHSCKRHVLALFLETLPRNTFSCLPWRVFVCVCVRRACVCVFADFVQLSFFFSLHKLPSVGQLTSPVYEVLLFVCGWKKTNYGAPTHEMWRQTTPDDIFLCLSCHANVAHPDLPSPIPTPPYRHESREKLCSSAKPRVRGRTLCRG